MYQSVNGILQKFTFKSLAEQIETSTQVIHELDANSEKINKVVDVIKWIAEQTNLLDLITNSIEQINVQSMDISSTTTQQSEMLNSINQNIEKINNMAAQSANGAQHSLVNVERLSELASQLNKTTSRFHI